MGEELDWAVDITDLAVAGLDIVGQQLPKPSGAREVAVSQDDRPIIPDKAVREAAHKNQQHSNAKERAHPMKMIRVGSVHHPVGAFIATGAERFELMVC